MKQALEASGEVFASERQERIERMLDEHGRARVIDLAEQFGVSTVTIRKDLVALEGQGRLMRAHGGAIALKGIRAETAFDVRERLNREARTPLAGSRQTWSMTVNASPSTPALPRLPSHATSGLEVDGPS